MSSYSLSDLVGSFWFSSAQSNSFFADGANRLERFLAVDSGLAWLAKEAQVLHS